MKLNSMNTSLHLGQPAYIMVSKVLSPLMTTIIQFMCPEPHDIHKTKFCSFIKCIFYHKQLQSRHPAANK